MVDVLCGKPAASLLVSESVVPAKIGLQQMQPRAASIFISKQKFDSSAAS